MKRLWIVGLLVMGAAAATPVPASADWRVAMGASHDRGARGAGPAFRRVRRGWREGSEEGNRDGRRSRDPRFWREGEYRDGDRGYKGWMGPRWDYTAGFRQGYEAGYRRAFAAARPSWRDGGRDRGGTLRRRSRSPTIDRRMGTTTAKRSPAGRGAAAMMVW
jgi:hypothetical protein